MDLGIEETEKTPESSQPKAITKTIILPDGSYGTQTIMVDDSKKSQLSQDECSYLSLRNALVFSEDDYLAACLAVTLTKLTVKAKKNLSLTFKTMSVDSILIICAMLKERQANLTKDSAALQGAKQRMRRTDQDSLQRMQLCLKVLTKPDGLK